MSPDEMRSQPFPKSGTASMVLGIVSLVGLLVIFEIPFSLATAPLGLAVGVASLSRKAPRRGRAIAGVVCSAIAIVAIVLGILALIAIGNAFDWGDD